ncbi:hypothetical protein QN360_10765, partial [Glaciimonas sp. CA11.2]
MKKFALWAPDMASRGGVQSYMWRLWEMLHQIDDASICGLVLNNTSAQLNEKSVETAAAICGCAGSKVRFVFEALSGRYKGHVVIVGHLHLSPITWLARRVGLIKGYIIILHGIEAWKRNTFLERLALRQADSVVATTNFTAIENKKVNGLLGGNYHIISLCA